MAKITTTLLFLTTYMFVLRYHQCLPNTNASDALEDPKELLFRELSMDAYFNLPFHEPGDTAVSMRRQYTKNKYFNEINWLSTTDYEYQKANDQPALKWGPGGAVVDTDFYNNDKTPKTLSTMNPDSFTIFHLCYAISYIWRRGRKGIHRYFARRQTYYDHMPFEVGYITQTIMAKYQNVLELYEYSTRMEKGQRMGRPHLYFYYKNILEDCRAIIHLCNMIHEVTRKYRVLQYSAYNAPWIPVIYDPAQRFQDPAGTIYRDQYPIKDARELRELERGVEGFEHEKHFHEDPKMFARIKGVGLIEEEEKKRLAKNLKKQRNYFNDHCSWASTTSTSRRTRSWRSNQQPLVYGWDTGAEGDTDAEGG